MTVARDLEQFEQLAENDGSTSVSVMETGQRFDVAPGETVLAAALRAGLNLASDCKSGFCGACRVQILSGEIEQPADLPGLSIEEQSCGFALGCQTRALTTLVIDATLLPSDLPQPVTIEATVVKREDPALGITRLTLFVPGSNAFLPGQFVDVLLPDGTSRSFSIACTPAEDLIELHIRRIPGGQFTAGLLDQIDKGSPLRLEMPKGSFRLHPEDFRPILFVATGTGIAPILAMLHELAADAEDAPPIAVYWGMRDERDLYARDEIADLGKRFEEFSFRPVLSRPDQSWGGRRGYVHTAVLEDFPDLSEHSIYLCGNPDMIRDARQSFSGAGSSINHTYSDAFAFNRPR